MTQQKHTRQSTSPQILYQGKNLGKNTYFKGWRLKFSQGNKFSPTNFNQAICIQRTLLLAFLLKCLYFVST